MLTSEKLIAINCFEQKVEDAVHKRYTDILFKNQEHGTLHNPYDGEVRLLNSIENGDLVQLKHCWSEQYHEMYGSLAPTHLRNVKNLCIVVIAFASRAAIRGGVHPETAFSLCDSYIQNLEACTDSVTLTQLVHKAEEHFTELVAHLRLQTPHNDPLKKTPHILKCKDYIFTHLHEKITVKDIADALHLNVNYLSSLFKKYEGQSISDFIMNEKILLAQNFLRYSSYTYSEIATYLGFASQSHLGTHFKKIRSEERRVGKECTS